MEKIINNHRYSTETSTFIGEYSNELDVSDEQYIYESLYRKRTGEFFLFCKGGAKTMYSKKINNKRVYNEDIELTTYDEAEKWAKTHLSQEIYDYYFNLDKTPKKFTSNRQTVTVRLPEEYIRKLQIARARTDLIYPELFMKMIDEFLKTL